MRVRLQAQCLQKCSINSLSVCVSFGQNALKALNLSGVWICLSVIKSLSNTTHCMGIYTHTQQVLVEGSIDGPKDHLSMTMCPKDQHGHRRIILRCLMVEPWSNHIFRAPRRISCILRGYPSIQTTSCCPSQTRRIVDLVNLQTDLETSFTYRPNTDKVQTQVHQQTPPWL